MTSPNTNNARRPDNWIAILLGKLRLGLHFYLLLFSIIILMMASNSAFAQTQTCAIINAGDAGGGLGVSPTYLANQDGRANEGCTILITLNADGSITTTFPNPAPSYDQGLDDNLIGLVNNTNKVVTAVQLTSATVPIFGL
ncbi:MAG TPA: hypothetical protein VE054_08605, partial [Blattabacteriaceae bacterium]|nr:hypothetical protein [Blattabacteriaceae bacterium]